MLRHAALRLRPVGARPRVLLPSPGASARFGGSAARRQGSLRRIATTRPRPLTLPQSRAPKLLPLACRAKWLRKLRNNKLRACFSGAVEANSKFVLRPTPRRKKPKAGAAAEAARAGSDDDDDDKPAIEDVTSRGGGGDDDDDEDEDDEDEYEDDEDEEDAPADHDHKTPMIATASVCGPKPGMRVVKVYQDSISASFHALDDFPESLHLVEKESFY